jgi:hypothetical protein
MQTLFAQHPPQPAYRVQVAGRDITPLIDARLIDLVLTDNRGFEADQLDITLDDSDGTLDLPPRGARVRVALGWAGQALEDKGEYVVDEVEHSGAPDKLTLRARSADLRGSFTTRREQSWHATTLGDILRTIAGRNQVQAVIADALAAQAVAHLDQTDESDANLLTRLARDFDAIATIKDGRLLFMPAGQAATASGQPLPPVTLTRSSGDSHRFAVADRGAYTGVKAYWHNTRTGKKDEVLVGEGYNESDETSPESGGLRTLTRVYASKKAAQRAARDNWAKIQAGPNRRQYSGVRANWADKKTGKSGSELAGKEGHPPAPPATEPSADNLKVLRHIYATKDNAERAARAEWQRQQRGVAEFSLTLAIGRPELMPELPVKVEGFKPQIDEAAWIIARITHRLGDGGLTTVMELEVLAKELPA